MRKKLPLLFKSCLALCLLLLLGLNGSSQCGLFYDGYESGTWSPTWTAGTGTYTRTVMTSGGPVGNNYFQQSSTASNVFYQGTYTTFTPGQPTYMSWWMRTNTTTAANGYVVIGDGNIASDNGVIFCYFNATSGLRFFNTSGYNHPITANTWYYVECRNMNWTTRTSDIYVNGSLILSNWAFRSGSATTVDRVHLFSLSASNAEYDNFQIGVPGATISGATSTPATCNGLANASLDLSATTVNGSLTYAWSNGATTQDLTGIAAGTYAVTVTDSLGCTATGSYLVAEPALLTAVASPSAITCPGGTGSIALAVSGGTPGYGYLWSNGDTTQTTSNVLAGTYSVAVTDSNGCTASDTTTIAAPAAFASSAVVMPPLCFDGTDGAIDYSLSGGTTPYAYSWSNGALVEDPSSLASGTYVVTATDSLGCVFTDSVAVVAPAPMNFNAVVLSPACNGFGNGSITLAPTGGTPQYTYAWSIGGAGNAINASAGTYAVTVTDANGCVQADSFLVTEPAVIGLSALTTADDGTTNGAIDLTVVGGTPGFTYSWSNGATTQDISGLAAGSYTVTVTDANGCTSTQSFTVDLVIGTDPGSAWSVTAAPNPFVAQFVVQLAGLGSDVAQLRLTDLAGRVVWSAEVAGDGNFAMEKELAVGTYLLQVQQGGRTWVKRMVKQ